MTIVLTDLVTRSIVDQKLLHRVLQYMDLGLIKTGKNWCTSEVVNVLVSRSIVVRAFTVDTFLTRRTECMDSGRGGVIRGWN